ncbi:MAG: FAD-dependent oxidoreductase [Bifidobacteriaceae bacterium]|nr:FAD-dependent oxidoreductase [Bifidobacteriaceae bacterium]
MQQNDMYDVIVIGGGPAGLTAGLYLARARYRVLVLEQEAFGGQITITSEVVNYPGIAVTDGKQLTETMREQAQNFGAEFMLAQATGLEVHDDVKVVHTNRGDFKAFGILLATGASPRKLGFIGEKEFAGRGVAYCATCDGEFFTGKEVLVIGGGFAAAEEAVFLTKYASKVTILVREDDFTCDAAVAAEAKNHPKIEIKYHTQIDEVKSEGASGLTSAVIHDVHSKESSEWKPTTSDTFGVFVFAGYVPKTELVQNVVELDDQGYVITRDYLQTSVPGVYAAGDLRVKNLRQVVTATADGAIAAVELERYAKTMSEKTGIVPNRPTTSATPEAANKTIQQDASTSSEQSGAFSADVLKQLNMVFSKLTKPVILQLTLDNSNISSQLESFITNLVESSDSRLTMEITRVEQNAYDASEVLPQALPLVRICTLDEEKNIVDSGLAFHGIPSGHEFNSFILGIYNVGSNGQGIDEDSLQRIKSITTNIKIQLLVSLTCTMCPETVLSAQRIASLNPSVQAEAYDISHFEDIKDHYDVMSVPCIIITQEDGSQTVEFGKKNIAQMLDLIQA